MIDQRDLERMPVQLAVREGVRLALETPLREPILEAVDATVGRRPADATGNDGTHTERSESRADGNDASVDGGSRLGTLVQWLVGILVLFAVLYVTLRKLTDDEP